MTDAALRAEFWGWWGQRKKEPGDDAQSAWDGYRAGAARTSGVVLSDAEVDAAIARVMLTGVHADVQDVRRAIYRAGASRFRQSEIMKDILK